MSLKVFSHYNIVKDIEQVSTRALMVRESGPVRPGSGIISKSGFFANLFEYDRKLKRFLRRRSKYMGCNIWVFAVVLLPRAIWDMIVEILSPTMTLIVGLIFLGIVALLEKEYVKKLF
jgi:hypothetical protein